MPAENSKVRVGRDLNGQLVIGDGNTIVVGVGVGGAGQAPPPAIRQQNTAEDHGTVHSAAHGDIHIHHHHTADEPDPSDEAEDC